MSKSRARFLAELLNSSGQVKATTSALAGADGVIDLEVLPILPNSQLEHSSISIAGHTLSLGGSLSLDTSDITEHASYLYYTDARVGSYLTTNSYATARGATNWNDGTVLNNVVGLLSWKNYGNDHVIFDASASTSPTGSAVNNTNSAGAWTASYPTLMGWNGSSTYGVRVDSARVADTASNAELLDGIDSTSFLRSDAADTIGGRLTMGLQHALIPADYGIGVSGLYDPSRYQHVWSMGADYGTSSDGTSYGNMYGLTWTHTDIGTGANQSIAGLSHQLQLRENGVLKCAFGTGIWTAHNITSGGQGTLWGSSNDGSGSGLDADTVDGLQASQFLRSDANGTATGVITFQNSSDYQIALNGNGTYWAGISFTDTGGTDYLWYNGAYQTFALGGGGASVAGKKLHVDGGLSVGSSSDGTATPSEGIYSQGQISVAGSTVWHAGNDGSGSGLDADLLDGNQATAFATAAQGTLATNALPKAGGTLTGNVNLSGSTNHIIIGGTASNNAYNSVSSTTGLTFGGGNDFSNYSIGTSMQDIGGNYTKLNIKWHTGIRFFTQPNYGGVRFHSDVGMSTELMSIGNIDVHVRVANNLYANGGGLVWNANNDGAGSGLDADLLDGLQLHIGRNNEANKVVRTDVNGYIQAGWINTTSGDSGVASRLTRIYSSSDDYLRYSTLTDFKVHMGLPAKNNYSRRIDYTGDSNYWVGSFGHSGYGANETFHGGSGFFDIWAGTNYPSGLSHIHGFNALHYTASSLGTTGGSAYGWQMAVQYDNDNPYFRRCVGGSFSAWRKIWNDANDGSGSGLDADLLDGLQASSFVQQGGSYYTVGNTAAFSGANDTTLSVRSNGPAAATMSFHKPGVFAANFGIDTDNQLKYGGWSAVDVHPVMHDGVYGGSVSNATNGGGVNYVYVDGTVSYAPTRGSCGNHVYQCWGGALTLTLNDASWQRGDIVVLSNVRGAANIVVNASVINMPNGSSDNQVTWNATVGSFRLCKYSTTAGYWMVLP